MNLAEMMSNTRYGNGQLSNNKIRKSKKMPNTVQQRRMAKNLAAHVKNPQYRLINYNSNVKPLSASLIEKIRNSPYPTLHIKEAQTIKKAPAYQINWRRALDNATLVFLEIKKDVYMLAIQLGSDLLFTRAINIILNFNDNNQYSKIDYRLMGEKTVAFVGSSSVKQFLKSVPPTLKDKWYKDSQFLKLEEVVGKKQEAQVRLEIRLLKCGFSWGALDDICNDFNKEGKIFFPKIDGSKSRS